MPRTTYRRKQTRKRSQETSAQRSARVYAEVSNRIADQLEAGVSPWSDFTKDRGRGRPRNIGGRLYRGCNALFLHPALHGYRDPRWATIKQINDAGGRVKPGESSSIATFWTFWAKPITDDAGTVTNQRIPVLRQYRVFNVAGQTEGVELDGLEELQPDREHKPEQEAARIVAEYLERDGPTLEHSGQARAFYRPAVDLVHMPRPERCTSATAYYSTLMHELVHSTGHRSRLDRDLDAGASFGSSPYAAEELVAELGACFVLAAAGLEHLTDEKNSAAYLAGWARAIRNSPKLFVQAAGKAQRAADLILDHDPTAVAPADDQADRPTPPTSPWPAERPNPKPQPAQTAMAPTLYG